jgi:hypothetical protein
MIRRRGKCQGQRKRSNLLCRLIVDQKILLLLANIPVVAWGADLVAQPQPAWGLTPKPTSGLRSFGERFIQVRLACCVGQRVKCPSHPESKGTYCCPWLKFTVYYLDSRHQQVYPEKFVFWKECWQTILSLETVQDARHSLKKRRLIWLSKVLCS